jgi:hypothetical protein
MATTVDIERTAPSVDAARNAILREIARGGLAGLVVGIVLGGIGGRLVMRLAAVLVPSSAGSFTENGNVIGTITVGGSVALIVFLGLLAGVFAGSLWVIIRPWLPSGMVARALVTMPFAVAIGSQTLVDDRNRDFAILDRDPLVVASLIALVALFGPALAVVDGWLERRLPIQVSGRGETGYALVTALGVLLTLFLVAPTLLGAPLFGAGIAVAVIGLATLTRWGLATVARSEPPWLPWVARGAFVVATVAGLAATTREVIGILGVR